MFGPGNHAKGAAPREVLRRRGAKEQRRINLRYVFVFMVKPWFG
jgi:hypothetical protein